MTTTTTAVPVAQLPDRLAATLGDYQLTVRLSRQGGHTILLTTTQPTPQQRS